MFVDVHKGSQGTSTQWIAEGGIVDLFVFAGPTPADVVAQYTSLTGMTALPQLFAIGYHQVWCVRWCRSCLPSAATRCGVRWFCSLASLQQTARWQVALWRGGAMHQPHRCSRAVPDAPARLLQPRLCPHQLHVRAQPPPSPLLPFFLRPHTQCRWNYKDEADVAAVNAKFDEHEMPYDVIWLDIDHTDGKKWVRTSDPVAACCTCLAWHPHDLPCHDLASRPLTHPPPPPCATPAAGT